MNDAREGATSAKSLDGIAALGRVARMEYRWMCRVVRDRTVYETPAAMVRYAVDDKTSLESATKDNPAPSWSGDAVYWRERRATGEDQQGLFQQAA